MTTGEINALPFGTVLERERDGRIFVVAKPGFDYHEGYFVSGNPKEPEYSTASSPCGNLRVIGNDPVTITRALASISGIQRDSGRWSAVIEVPDILFQTVLAVANAPGGDDVIIPEILRRGRVFGMLHPEYTGEAVAGYGFARFYLRDGAVDVRDVFAWPSGGS